MQKRLHQTIVNSAKSRNHHENRQLAEQLRKLTDEANELFHRLLEKHESSDNDPNEEHTGKE